MAENLPDLVARIRLDTTELDRGVTRASAFGSAIGSAVGGLAAQGIGALLSSVGSFATGAVSAAQESAKIGRATEAVIKATGGAALVTAQQVGDLATKISETTGVDDELIQTGENLLLTFKNVQNVGKGSAAVFDRATGAAVDLSAAGFGSVESASVMLGKALNDPTKGMTALSRAGVTFSAQQQQQIKDMQSRGDLLGAQQVILANVEGQVKGVAAATADPMVKAQVAVGNLQEKLGGYLLPVLGDIATFGTSTLLPALSGAFDWIAKHIGPVFDGIKGVIESVRAPVEGFLIRFTKGPLPLALETLGIKVMGFINSFKKTMGPAFEAVGRSVGPLLDALGRLGAAFVAHVLPAAQAVTRVFIANVLPLLMRLGQFVIGTIVPAIVRFAGIIADRMSPILAALGDFIRTRVAPAFALIVNKIQAAFVAAQPFIAVVLRIIGVILKVVGSILGFLIPILLKLIGPIFSLVFRIIGTAIGWFGKLLGSIGKIVNAFINAGASVGRFAVAVGQHVLTAIRWVAGLPGRILGALRGLGSLLFGIGKDLIQGFINGIKNIGHRVADAARAIVDKLPAVIKRALGISSPSKVMAALGEQAGAGFVGGLLGTVDAAGAAAGRLAAAASGLGFPGAAVGAATTASAVGGPVGVRVFIGDRELTDIVRVETDGALTGAARLIRAGAA